MFATHRCLLEAILSLLWWLMSLYLSLFSTLPTGVRLGIDHVDQFSGHPQRWGSVAFLSSQVIIMSQHTVRL